MKKIRLLALLLALLMIPFGMLFACDDDDVEDPDDDEETEGEGEGEGEGSGSGSGSGTQTPVGNKKVEDGSKTGYLAFFSFDKADNGNLGVIPAPTNTSDPNYLLYSDLKPVEPYSEYFKGALVGGGAYTVRTLSSTNKYLSVQRTGVNVTAPTLDFLVGEKVTDLESRHILQFDLEFTKGLFGAPAVISGVKASVLQSLIVIENDLIKDCNGTVIYGEKDTDTFGWISVAIVIDDARKTYDVIIDGIKQTSGIAYSNSSYGSWNQAYVSSYRFGIEGTNAEEVYLRLDNISIKNGKESDLNVRGEDSNNAFTDVAGGIKSFMYASVDGLKAFLDGQEHVVAKLKKDIFGTGLLLSNTFTLSKINTVTGEIVDVIHDYGALLGNYDENAAFVTDTDAFTFTTYNGKVVYDADIADAENELVEGTYTVAEGVITLAWGEGVEAPKGAVAAKYAEGVLTVYSDAACETKVADYNMTAPTGADYVLGEDEVFAVKMTNIKDIANSSVETVLSNWDKTWYANNQNKTDGVLNISFFATQDMVDRNVVFHFRTVRWYEATKAYYSIYTFAPEGGGGNAANKLIYEAGLNEFQIDLKNMKSNNAALNLGTMDSMQFTYSGWDDHGTNAYTVNDFEIYFTKCEFVLNGFVVEVEGPEEGMENCEHTDSIGDSAFVAVETPIPGSCAHGSYYVMQCTECGATKVDNTKPFGILGEHKYSDTLVVVEAACGKQGTISRVCEICGVSEVIETTPALEHDYVVVSIVGKNVTQICKHCGLPMSFILRTSLMTWQDKMNELLFSSADRNNWTVPEDKDIKITTSSGSLNGWINTVCKTEAKDGCFFESVYTDYGKMLRMKQMSSTGYETYIDIQPAGYGISFLKGESFAIEIDFMKGEPGANGGYLTSQLWPGWRNGPAPFTENVWGKLTFTANGDIQLSDYAKGTAGRPVFETEKGKVYNIALFHDLPNNKIKLYIDGKFFDECQFVKDTASSTIFSPTHYRFTFGNFSEGAEYFFNNYLHYPAEKEPICVLTEGFVGGGYEGDITLEDELLKPMLPEFDVAEDGHNVKVNVPAAHYLKEYVFEFAVSGIAKDGTLLKATKNGGGIDYDRDIVEIKEGKVYVLGVLVSEKLDIKLALAFDDNINALYVYVDGQKVAGTIYIDGDFASSGAIIRSFTLLTECGNYKVSALKMYTGTAVK